MQDDNYSKLEIIWDMTWAGLYLDSSCHIPFRKRISCCACNWVILPNLVHTGYLQFLTIFYNLTDNGHVCFIKTNKTPINTPK